MIKRLVPIVLLWVCGCGGSMRLAQESLATGQDSNLEIRNTFLGKSDKQILPTRTAVNKLLGILQHKAGGGVMDIVWDDMIDLKVE